MCNSEDLLPRLFDVAMVASGGVIASRIKIEFIAETSSYMPFVAFAAASTLLLFPGLGIYDSRLGSSKLMLASRVSFAWLAVQACVFALMFSLHPIDQTSRAWFMCWTAISGAQIIAGRLAGQAVFARMRHADIKIHRVAIVGCGRHCESVMQSIERTSHPGFRAIALFNASPGLHIESRVPVFDDLDAFVTEVREQDAKEVWLALPMSQNDTLQRFVNAFREDLVNVRYIPEMHGLTLRQSGVSETLGVPAIDLIASPFSRGARLEKEMFDRFFAFLALTSLAPLLTAIVVAMKLESRGPILDAQRHRGPDGRVFTLYKFRSTCSEAGATRVDALLRRMSLDGLPQLLNVLRGDMSMVGPRANPLEDDDLYRKAASGYVHRYRVKPGITGWAQVHGCCADTDLIEKMEARVAHDLYYLANWSFGLDMRIIAATVITGYRGA
jgi:Undecaprenyl-phosphate glucose phosphotransferase